jgi:alanyl-tRNA synthetase
LNEKEFEINLEKLNKIKIKYETLKVENNKKITVFEIDEIKKQVIKNNKLINIKVTNFESKNIGMALSEIINENKENFVSLLNITDDKVKYIFAVNENYAKENNFNLNKIIKTINTEFNGKGGGKFNYVQGGTNEINKLEEIEICINNEFKKLS